MQFRFTCMDFLSFHISKLHKKKYCLMLKNQSISIFSQFYYVSILKTSYKWFNVRELVYFHMQSISTCPNLKRSHSYMFTGLQVIKGIDVTDKTVQCFLNVGVDINWDTQLNNDKYLLFYVKINMENSFIPFYILIIQDMTLKYLSCILFS